MATAQAVAAPEAKQAEHSAPASLHGFELERQQWVAEYNSTVLLYKHTKTGTGSYASCPSTATVQSYAPINCDWCYDRRSGDVITQ